MEINADFTKRASVHAEALPWQPSPAKGVNRRMLDRIGGEVARATTIVRFDPGCDFAEHIHEGGEEFLVLEGVFQDNYGDFPAGTYVRNPIGTRHAPRSDEGCTILVKLWQFNPEDRKQFSLKTSAQKVEADKARPGVTNAVLFENEEELVRIENWSANADVSIGSEGGAEYFVLEGGFELDGTQYQKNDWLRLPEGDEATVNVGNSGCRVWSKTGHLPFVQVPVAD